MKAQVHAGGRGKGHFTNGFKGGVKISTESDKAHTANSRNTQTTAVHSRYTHTYGYTNWTTFVLRSNADLSAFPVHASFFLPLSPKQIREYASKMIGSSLITAQTGPEGQPCKQVRAHHASFSLPFLSSPLPSCFRSF